MEGAWLILLSVLAITCGFFARRRIQRIVRERDPLVTDEVLRSLLEEGTVEYDDPDEPLDEGEIREAEDDFWSDEWDDPGPWAG